MSPHCPCCGTSARLQRRLPRADMVAALDRLMPQGGAAACTFGDYELWRCAACGLEFSDPMAEPDRNFYSWMTLAEHCYPEDRWEWTAFLQQIASRAQDPGSPLLVLDVGCGMGRFLGLLRRLPGCRAIGLDVNLPSIEACRAQGLEALHGDLADCLGQLGRHVDAVTLWHVVEHVADPVGLLLQVKTLLKADGMIALSVPLSPLSYEASWPDPLNLPPHHLTRWGLPALHALAARLDMELRIVMPEADSFPIRVLRPLLLAAVSPFAHLRGPKRLLKFATYLLTHPWAPFTAILGQLRRPRIGGKVQPDVVLALLTTPRAPGPAVNAPVHA